MKLTYLEWIDSASIGNSWTSLEEVLKEKPRLVKQVGWILTENKEYLIIVATLDLTKEGQKYVSDGLVVVKSLIKKRIDLSKYV
ncbi:MAG TPA: hypothetical protein VNX68_16250 [Nitrosopumilaceae archaeon]|jgi:hypothetical protein|nr:hypothetical protein [Nitrosopumilaceae archaeon]